LAQSFKRLSFAETARSAVASSGQEGSAAGWVGGVCEPPAAAAGGTTLPGTCADGVHARVEITSPETMTADTTIRLDMSILSQAASDPPPALRPG